jgi:condensin complex subunit 2
MTFIKLIQVIFFLFLANVDVPSMEFDLGNDYADDNNDNESIADALPFHNDVIPPAFITQINKVVPLSYSKKAKRVDVQKLKENIWHQMNEIDMDQVNYILFLSQQVTSFSKVVQSLDNVYPSAVRNDISVPFCFICLLHLANEQDLSIISGASLNELTITKAGMKV